MHRKVIDEQSQLLGEQSLLIEDLKYSKVNENEE